MARPKKRRRVGFIPKVVYFKPRGVALASLEEVSLTFDEVEAIRLVDLEALGQVEAAKEMKISQSTFQRILAVAHQKVAECLVQGKAIRVKGGDYKMALGFGRGGGFGRGRGVRGRMGGSFVAGPGGTCVCTNPDCRYEATHQAGVPCYQRKCPKCGSPMTRKG